MPNWNKPKVVETCVGMEVTSYESADLEPDGTGPGQASPGR